MPGVYDYVGSGSRLAFTPVPVRSLAAAQGTAIMSSSGYDWKADAEILLDTAVIGAPGSVLPLPRPGQPPLPESWISHRRALSQWYRRTAGWEPLWLNSNKGAIGREPALRCFGRVERIAGAERLTAVALRAQKPEGPEAEPLRGMRWEGASPNIKLRMRILHE